MSTIGPIFSFHNPVNEVAARMVASMVVELSLATIISGFEWLSVALAYGFAARVLTGPTLSPTGLLATRVLVPRMGITPRLVPGPPKRFAQAIGLILSLTAIVFFFDVDSPIAAKSILLVLTIFAALESFLVFCAGCFVFNRLMDWGLVPESVCRDCAISLESPES